MDRAVLGFLMETNQLAQADRLLRSLLPDARGEQRAALWRLGVQLAEQRDMPARALECLEQALDAEYAHLPEVVNVQQVRQDYDKLLTHYQNLAQALATLKLAEPAGFRAKVIRAADRWRSLDRDGTQACQLAGRVLQTLGDKELVWDYLTTPVGMRPNESGPWADLARTLLRQGDVMLADRAFAAAFAVEPTDAQLLWERAENLRQAGRLAAARRLYRQLAEGSWQPRFAGLRTQARWQLEKP